LFFHLSNVDRFPDERALFYAAEIVLALGYLHSQNIIYRDLKPENLLLAMDGHVCLTDFGLVKENLGYGDVTHTFCGSPEYLAPEILQGKGYGRAVDWWALGTFIYEMLEGLPPFYDEDVAEMNRRILRQPLYFDAAHFSSEAMSLLEGLLQRDPDKRLGSGPQDYLEVTAHPFFKTINWNDLYHKRIDPSFKPHLQNATDVRYFDPEFTSQVPRHSVTTEKLSKQTQRAFDGFSYVSPSLEQAMAAKRKSMRASMRSGRSPSNSPSSPSPPVGTTNAQSTIFSVDV
jgi:serine/threonine protein kinase